MELLIIILVISLLVWFVVRGKSLNPTTVSNPSKPTYKDDYEIWFDIFKNEKSNIKEFDLFGTKAAIAWNEGDEEVVIICITAFRNSEPITKKWDHFEFNVRDKYWSGIQPKGSPARIREELKLLGLI